MKITCHTCNATLRVELAEPWRYQYDVASCEWNMSSSRKMCRNFHRILVQTGNRIFWLTYGHAPRAESVDCFLFHQTPEEIASGKQRVIKLAVDGSALMYHRNGSSQQTAFVHANHSTSLVDTCPGKIRSVVHAKP